MTLTRSEQFVVQCRCVGIPIKALGDVYGAWRGCKRSVKIVEFHWANARRKIGLYDVAAMTGWAFANGLIKLRNNNGITTHERPRATNHMGKNRA